MHDIVEGSLLWQPTEADRAHANLTRYLAWLRTAKGLDFPGYPELWAWSVADIDAFWASLWEYFDIMASAPYTDVLAAHSMPGAQWFPGARLNYAQHAFRHMRDDSPAILYQDETGPLVEVTWQELYTTTARIAGALKAMGVSAGDRVVARW